MSRACACPAPERLRTAPGKPDTSAIIAAAGTGERFGDPVGKQFVDLCGLPLAAWSILACDAAPSVGELVIICLPERRQDMEERVLARLPLTKPVRFADGAPVRQASCLAGVRATSPKFEFVAFQDAARPLTTTEVLEGGLALLRSDPDLDCVVCGQPAVDTLKDCDGDVVMATPDRSRFWQAQTPQIMRRQTALVAHEEAAAAGVVATDDSSLVERLGGRIRCFSTGWGNIKVTVPEDLLMARAIMEDRLRREGRPAFLEA